MPEKLTKQEKIERGTHQPCRDTEPRGLEEIQIEISEAHESLKDMQFNLSEAGRQIRAEGMFIEVIVTDKNGDFKTTKRLNPAFKVQREAMAATRSLKRYLVLLREEESIANEKKAKANEFTEFDK